MAKPEEPYLEVVVESYRTGNSSGLHGDVHVRPVAGRGFPTGLSVECAKRLSRDYPVGTQFKVRAKVADKGGGKEFLYSYFGWPATVLPNR